MMTPTEFEQWCHERAIASQRHFSAEELAPQFVPYFRTGQRIRVLSRYGESRTGTVGVTTGWKPAFLLIARRSNHGSSDVLHADDVITAVQVGRKYEAVTP